MKCAESAHSEMKCAGSAHSEMECAESAHYVLKCADSAHSEMKCAGCVCDAVCVTRQLMLGVTDTKTIPFPAEPISG